MIPRCSTRVKSKRIESLWEEFEELQDKIDEMKLKEEEEEESDDLICVEQETERQIFENIYFKTATDSKDSNYSKFNEQKSKLRTEAQAIVATKQMEH